LNLEWNYFNGFKLTIYITIKFNSAYWTIFASMNMFCAESTIRKT